MVLFDIYSSSAPCSPQHPCALVVPETSTVYTRVACPVSLRNTTVTMCLHYVPTLFTCLYLAELHSLALCRNVLSLRHTQYKSLDLIHSHSQRAPRRSGEQFAGTGVHLEQFAE